MCHGIRKSNNGKRGRGGRAGSRRSHVQSPSPSDSKSSQRLVGCSNDELLSCISIACRNPTEERHCRSILRNAPICEECRLEHADGPLEAPVILSATEVECLFVIWSKRKAREELW